MAGSRGVAVTGSRGGDSAYRDRRADLLGWAWSLPVEAVSLFMWAWSLFVEAVSLFG
jgi:hypothetical protein